MAVRRCPHRGDRARIGAHTLPATIADFGSTLVKVPCPFGLTSTCLKPMSKDPEVSKQKHMIEGHPKPEGHHHPAGETSKTLSTVATEKTGEGAAEGSNQAKQQHDEPSGQGKQQPIAKTERDAQRT